MGFWRAIPVAGGSGASSFILGVSVRIAQASGRFERDFGFGESFPRVGPPPQTSRVSKHDYHYLEIVIKLFLLILLIAILIGILGS